MFSSRIFSPLFHNLACALICSLTLPPQSSHQLHCFAFSGGATFCLVPLWWVVLFYRDRQPPPQPLPWVCVSELALHVEQRASELAEHIEQGWLHSMLPPIQTMKLVGSTELGVPWIFLELEGRGHDIYRDSTSFLYPARTLS